MLNSNQITLHAGLYSWLAMNRPTQRSGVASSNMARWVRITDWIRIKSSAVREKGKMGGPNQVHSTVHTTPPEMSFAGNLSFDLERSSKASHLLFTQNYILWTNSKKRYFYQLLLLIVIIIRKYHGYIHTQQSRFRCPRYGSENQAEFMFFSGLRDRELDHFGRSKSTTWLVPWCRKRRAQLSESMPCNTINFTEFGFSLPCWPSKPPKTP